MKRLALAFLLCLPTLASSPWTPTQYVLEGAYQAALLCDWRQTSDFHKPGPTTVVWGGGTYTEPSHIHESNPLLGRHPSQATINQMCLLSSVGHLAISAILPNGWRTAWQGVTLGIEVGFVAHNCSMGVRVKF